MMKRQMDEGVYRFMGLLLKWRTVDSKLAEEGKKKKVGVEGGVWWIRENKRVKEPEIPSKPMLWSEPCPCKMCMLKL